MSAQPEADAEQHFEEPPAPILYEGDGLLAIDKPAGIPVHRGTAHETGIAERMSNWASVHPGVLPLGTHRQLLPLHRLDREASGALLLGVHRAVARKVQTGFADRSIRKRYLAVIAGPLKESGQLRGKVRSRLRGRYRYLPARLAYRRLAGDERLSLVEVEPQEGRTHQIRALFALHNRPLAGDLRYGRAKPAQQFLEKFGIEYLVLHACELALETKVLGHPLTIAAPPSPALLRVLEEKGWPASCLDG